MEKVEKVKIALIQMKVVEEVELNLRCAGERVAEAAGRGAQIVVLPEMFCCPYTSKSFVKNQEPQGGRAWQALRRMAADSHVYLIGGSVPECDGEGHIYNTCFVFSPDGVQRAGHRKVHLFDIDVPGGQSFRESNTFTAGDEFTVIDTEYGRTGVEICFDIRFEEQTRLMALSGARMIFVPAAFNMTTGPAHWELLFRSRALDNQLYMFGCAPARDEKGAYVSYGNSIAVSPWGEVLGRLGADEGILYVEADMGRVDAVREQIPVLKNRRADLYELKRRR